MRVLEDKFILFVNKQDACFVSSEMLEESAQGGEHLSRRQVVSWARMQENRHVCVTRYSILLFLQTFYQCSTYICTARLSYIFVQGPTDLLSYLQAKRVSRG